MRVPVLLNFPALIAQLPYVIPVRREWIPRGMLPEVWRALSWPVAGVFFWWLAGRGVDALRAARKSVLAPRMTIAETVFAALLFVVGAVTLVGIITSTPADRADMQFLAMVAGGILWGILASITITARFLQWRMGKRSVAAPVLT